MQNYKKRIADKKIEHYLKLFGAVTIEGPKYCGKTWAGRYHSNSEVLLHNKTGETSNNVELAKISPSIILEGEKPKLIDEWQEATNLQDEIRADVDRTGLKGQYILTGLSTPNRKGILHSGAGRYGKIYLRTMSLYESGDSTGEISLKDICENKMKLLLKSLARNESTTVSNMTIKRDISETDNANIDVDTVASYLNALNKLYLLDNDEPFSPNVRSSIRVKKSEKRHFADPSIACALLNIREESKLINDLETFGFLFEAMVERDLKIYADSFGGKCYHYQDYQNRESDSIIELENGEWCAFEVKLGANKIEEAANNLNNIKDAIEKEKGKPPAVLCVICGMSNAAYKRPDGVYVVPITALKP